MLVKTHIILSPNDIKLLNEKYIKCYHLLFIQKIKERCETNIQVKLFRKIALFITVILKVIIYKYFSLWFANEIINYCN